MEYILESTSAPNAPATIKKILRSGLSADLQRVVLSALTIPPEACTAILAGQFVIVGDEVVVEVDEVDADRENRRRSDVLAKHEHRLRHIFVENFCAAFEANSPPVQGRTYEFLKKVGEIAYRAWGIVWDLLTQGRVQAGQIPELAYMLCSFSSEVQ